MIGVIGELTVRDEVGIDELRLVVDEDEVDPRLVDSIGAAPRPAATSRLAEERVGEAQLKGVGELDETLSLRVPIATAEGSEAALILLAMADPRVEVADE